MSHTQSKDFSVGIAAIFKKTKTKLLRKSAHIASGQVAHDLSDLRLNRQSNFLCLGNNSGPPGSARMHYVLVTAIGTKASPAWRTLHQPGRKYIMQIYCGRDRMENTREITLLIHSNRASRRRSVRNPSPTRCR